jgi:hypothetical protein
LKFLISAAIWVDRAEVSNRVMSPTPDTPWIRFCQVSPTECPTGVKAPIPVITTLLFIFKNLVFFVLSGLLQSGTPGLVCQIEAVARETGINPDNRSYQD